MTHKVVSTRAVTSFFINMKQYFSILMALIFYLAHATIEHSIVYRYECSFGDNESSSLQFTDPHLWHENFSEILDDDNSLRLKVHLVKFIEFQNVPSGSQSIKGGITRITDYIRELCALNIVMV